MSGNELAEVPTGRGGRSIGASEYYTNPPIWHAFSRPGLCNAGSKTASGARLDARLRGNLGGEIGLFLLDSLAEREPAKAR